MKAIAKGTGYAMFQVESEHRVERDFQQANPDDYVAFQVDVPHIIYSGKNFSNMDMRVCTKYVSDFIFVQCHFKLFSNHNRNYIHGSINFRC